MYRSLAPVYDRLMKDAPYAQWLAFAGECWERFGAPRSVADLGCGTGTVSLALAQMGFRVTGIDLSSDMLAAAREKTGRLLASSAFAPGGSVEWIQQDMTEWEVPEPVDAAVSFCDSLNYLLEEERVVRLFRRTREGLAKGGLFLFDMHSPALLETYAAEQPFALSEEDIAYVWFCDYDPARRQIEHDLTVFVREEEGTGERFRRIRERHAQRAYEPEWIEGELRAAGFDVLAVCADFTWKAPTGESDRIFFVARNPRGS